MSSSSSLSAARRRRAGGQQPVSNSLPEPPKPHQSSPRPSGNAPAPNPYMLLQQHHVKINELEKKMNEISSRKNTESTSTSTNVSSDAINSQIDVTKFSDMIINKIDNSNISLLEQFIENKLPDTFRYFRNRNITCIKNHLITLIGTYNDEPIAYGHLDLENYVWLGVCVLPVHQKTYY